MDKIIISDLHLRTIIGFKPWEREKPQDVMINITLFTDVCQAGRTDAVDDCLDYKTITKAVIAHVEESSYNLVEKLATEIARVCLEGGADRCLVRVEKPGALRFSRSVGVEIERTPADFE